MPPAAEEYVLSPPGCRNMTTASSGPWAHSVHDRLETSHLPDFSLSLSQNLCSCSRRSLSSLGSLCPSGRDCEPVVVIRGDCWAAGCHGTTEARPALPRCHHFPGWIHNHCNERHKHGKGERSGSLLTIISLQSEVRGSRLSRRAHLDMGQAPYGEGPGVGWLSLHCVLTALAQGLCSQHSFLQENIVPNPRTVRPGSSMFLELAYAV